MLSPEARPALRRQWLDDLTVEIARRTKTRADIADGERQQLLAELEEMGRRFLAVTPPERAGLPSKSATVEELIQANGDWSRIDRIRIRADLAPAEAIAIVLTQNPKLAMRMLTGWARGRGYAVS